MFGTVSWGYRIDPLRFRANIYIDGAPAWAEFDWVGSDIQVGEAVLHADRRNGRCSATNVDPSTGRRDLDIPGSLRKAFGHKDLGIYLLARTNDCVSVGDNVRLPLGAAVRSISAQTAAPSVERNAFICRGCYFVYDEAQGLPLAGVAPGTPFEALPRTWQCPDCGTDKATFRTHPKTPARRPRRRRRARRDELQRLERARERLNAPLLGYRVSVEQAMVAADDLVPFGGAGACDEGCSAQPPEPPRTVIF